MKKKLNIIIVTILVLLLSTATAFAAQKTNIKGQVQSIDPSGTVTLLTSKGDTFSVIAPADFDLSTLSIGDNVLVSGEANDDGTIIATKMVKVGKPSDKAGGKPDDAGNGKPEFPNEGKLNHSAFCDSEKENDNLNALISGISKKYDITQAELIGYYCDGYSLGAILLAMKTSELSGEDFETILSSRADGENWGAIWKASNLVGNEKDGKSPPGWLNRSDKATKP